MSIMVFVGVLTEMATKFRELGRKESQTVKKWVRIRRAITARRAKKISVTSVEASFYLLMNLTSKFLVVNQQ